MNGLNDTLKNILKINDVQNDDLAQMISRYVHNNFLKSTHTDIFADKDFIEKVIIKTSISIVTNCNFITNTAKHIGNNSIHCEEIPASKNYIEFENFKELNNWIVDLFDQTLFLSKTCSTNENDIEEKMRKVVEELNDYEIIPFELPIDFIISTYKAGAILQESMVEYLRSLKQNLNSDNGNLSVYGTVNKDDVLFHKDIIPYSDELTEHISECMISQFSKNLERKKLSFSEIVESELQKSDNLYENNDFNFILGVSFSFGRFFEKMEIKLKTLEDIALQFFKTLNSCFQNNSSIQDKKTLFLSYSIKSQLTSLIRQNIISLSIFNRFLLVKVLHEGSFSKIYVGFDLASFKLVCLKRLMGKFSDNQYLKNSLIEANYLKVLSKSSISRFVPNFVDVLVTNNNVFIVSELQGKNLFNLIKSDSTKTYLTFGKIQRIIKQLLLCIRHLHESLQLIHCDIKPENIVIERINEHDIFDYLNEAQTEISEEINIKLIDWGSCLSIDQASNTRNSYVQSRYYRSPEVCLGLAYNEKIDIWSVGCVMAELVLRRPLFEHNNSTQQLLANIVSTIGKIPMQMVNNSSTIFHFITHDGHLFDRHLNRIRLFTTLHKGLKHKDRISELFDANNNPLFVDLLNKLLRIDPEKRLSASQALNHPWFSYQYLN